MAQLRLSVSLLIDLNRFAGDVFPTQLAEA